MAVGVLQPNTEEAVHREMGDSNLRQEKPVQRWKRPIPDFEPGAVTEVPTRLMIKTAQPQHGGHLDQTSSASFEHPADLRNGRRRILSTEVLEHAVGEDTVNGRLPKGQKTGVPHHVCGFYPDLL